MKLHLGCGTQILPGFVNVDNDPFVKPDVICDLEKFPWPFEDNSVEYFQAHHVLEHLGETKEIWFGVWKELYRVAKSNAIIDIIVPHPRNDTFWADPTHVRAIYPETITMFNQEKNISDYLAKKPESKLGLVTGIDLEVFEFQYDIGEIWEQRLRNGQITVDQMKDQVIHLANVCTQMRMKARFHKPGRGIEWMKANGFSNLVQSLGSRG